MVPYLIKKEGIPMYNELIKIFNEGAAGINVTCDKCGKVNFVSTNAMSANRICNHCGGDIILSEQSKNYLRSMIASVKIQG